MSWHGLFDDILWTKPDLCSNFEGVLTLSITPLGMSISNVEMSTSSPGMFRSNHCTNHSMLAKPSPFQPYHFIIVTEPKAYALPRRELRNDRVLPVGVWGCVAGDEL